jgi:hypothetical protein
MPSLAALLRKSKDLTRRLVEIEHELAEIDRQILAAERPRKPPATRAARIQDSDGLRLLVKMLRDAGTPLPRREIASRLGVAPQTATYHLTRAIEMRFVERVGYGLYQVTNVVPAF